MSATQTNDHADGCRCEECDGNRGGVDLRSMRAQEHERKLLARIEKLERLLRLTGKPRQFRDQLCWCETVAGTYCVGQPLCREIQAALEKERKDANHERARIQV
jgi:hypothetical protein